MIILVINCGSSSIKYQLLDMKSDDVYDIIAKGIAEKIGLPAGILQYAPSGRDKIVMELPPQTKYPSSNPLARSRPATRSQA